LNLACLHAGLVDASAESARGRHLHAKLVGVDGGGQDGSSGTVGRFRHAPLKGISAAVFQFSPPGVGHGFRYCLAIVVWPKRARER